MIEGITDAPAPKPKQTYEQKEIDRLKGIIMARDCVIRHLNALVDIKERCISGMHDDMETLRKRLRRATNKKKKKKR